METVKSAVEAYAEGRIHLPEVPQGTAHGRIRWAPRFQKGDRRAAGDHGYTGTTLAEFLGWQKPSGGPSDAIETALSALEMVEAGVLEEDDLKGLSREAAKEAILGTCAGGAPNVVSALKFVGSTVLPPSSYPCNDIRDEPDASDEGSKEQGVFTEEEEGTADHEKHTHKLSLLPGLPRRLHRLHVARVRLATHRVPTVWARARLVGNVLRAIGTAH